MRKSMRKNNRKGQEQKAHNTSLDSTSSIISDSSSSSGTSSTKTSPKKGKEVEMADLPGMYQAVQAIYFGPNGHKNVLKYKTNTKGYHKILAGIPAELNDSTKEFLAGISKFKFFAHLQENSIKKARDHLTMAEDLYKDNPQALLEYYKSLLPEVSKNENPKNPIKAIGEFVQKNIINKLASLGIELLNGLTAQLENLLTVETLNIEEARQGIHNVEEFIQNNAIHINEEDMISIKANFCDLLQDLASKYMEKEQYDNAVEFLRKADEYAKEDTTKVEIATELAIAYSILANQEAGAMRDGEKTTWEVQAINKLQFALPSMAEDEKEKIKETPETWTYVAQAHYKIGDYAVSRDVCKKAINAEATTKLVLNSYCKERIADTLYKCGVEYAKNQDYATALDCYETSITTSFNLDKATAAIIELNKVQDKLPPNYRIVDLIDKTEAALQKEGIQSYITKFYEGDIPGIKLEAYFQTRDFKGAKEYADGLIYKNPSKILQLTATYTKISHGLVNTHPDLANEAQNIISLSKKLKTTMDIVNILRDSDKPEVIAEKLAPILSAEEFANFSKLLVAPAVAPTPAPRTRSDHAAAVVKELQDELTPNNDEQTSIYPDLTGALSALEALAPLGEVSGLHNSAG